MPRPATRLLALAALVATSAVTSGCGGGSSPRPAPHGPGTGRPPVVIGSQYFTEQRILGELYAQALRAKGYRVRLLADLPTAAADRALVDGRIDGYPEYVSAILDTLERSAAPPRSIGAALRAVSRLEARRGFTVLAPTPYGRTDGLATTAAYARRHALAGIGDLAGMGPFSLGGIPSFAARPAGLPALRRAYGLADAVFRPLGSGTQYAALAAGRVQAAVVQTTDPALRTGRYAVLSDPRHVLGVGNVVPVFARGVIAAEGHEFASTVDAVSAKLTTSAMRTMNAAVQVDKRSPADVARGFLRANGLL